MSPALEPVVEKYPQHGFVVFLVAFIIAICVWPMVFFQGNSDD